ncbi:MAG: hypothetical protein AAF604_16455 [Acidobacteriota bacterium]
MSQQPLGFADYLKAAFLRRVDVPLLGPMPVNLMAVGVIGVLGLANPGFWLLGAAAELAFVTATASSERFQKLVQGERLMQKKKQFDHKVQVSMNRLSPRGRKRYRTLLDQCRQILGISESLGSDNLGGNLRDLRSRNLNQLLGIFLRLLVSREILLQNLRNVDSSSLEKKIAELEKRLADAGEEGDPALRRSLEGTLEIQQKRLDNLERASANLEVIDAELLRIEQQVQLIREESAVSGGPEALSDRLDTVTSTMTETARWMDEHRDILGPASQEEAFDLPDLGREVETEG